MTIYSVADAKNGLPRLIARALRGEEVIISRHGKPVAELRPFSKSVVAQGSANHAWLKARRQARKGVDMASVEILDQLYNEPRA